MDLFWSSREIKTIKNGEIQSWKLQKEDSPRREESGSAVLKFLWFCALGDGHDHDAMNFGHCAVDFGAAR